MSAIRSTADMARRLGAHLQGADAGFERVCTDTRKLLPGDLFVALQGPNFDGHDYLRRAAMLGASAALVSRPIDTALPQVQVENVLDGLQRYAASWRADFSLPVIGITGSNGKTTVRALCEAVLAPMGSVLATEGNLNNHIGLPLMLSRLEPTHAAAVLEMGANHIGEIAALAALARPGIGVVTQAGDAHLEGFGSREGVAQGKGEMFEALPADGVAIINADDAFAPWWDSMAAHCQRIRFGFDAGADVRAEGLIGEPADAPTHTRFRLLAFGERHEVRLPLPGRHNVLNALAAAAVGYALNLPGERIADGLSHVVAPAGRLVWHETRLGARVLDDSYNANPGSLAAGLALLGQARGHRVLVLGDMAELGDAAERLHMEAGLAAREAGVSRLYVAGRFARHAATAFGTGAEVFDEVDTLNARLLSAIEGDWVVLVKGSRSARMERVIQALVTVGEARV
jgi:UDP-N-acetylmuramoyl-tripeptide--D-alanyl-D-alanine ligase